MVTENSSSARSDTYLAVLCLRNEGAFLLDWLAHHLSVGFNRFLVFSNNCQDGTDRMLDRLAELGVVTHLRNDGPYHDRGIQFTALKAAQKHPLVKEADWILPLDIDEFVNIKTGAGTLPDLIRALPEATAITLTWRLFGNAGVQGYRDVPVPTEFTRCAPQIMHWPWRAAMFKTLYRNDGSYRALGVHRPRNPRPERMDVIKWFDCDGAALPEVFKTSRVFSDYRRPNATLAQLNHYPLGAMESYVLKTDRGRVNRTREGPLGMDYWVERNFNTEEDRTILDLMPRTATQRIALAQDPALAQLHQNAVQWRHCQFDRLMREEHARSLYGRLLVTPGSQPVTREGAAQMLRFARLSAHQKLRT